MLLQWLSYLYEGGFSAERTVTELDTPAKSVHGLDCNGGRRAAEFYDSACCSPSP